MGGADPIQFRRGVGDVPEQFRRGGGVGMRASLRAYRRRLEHDRFSSNRAAALVFYETDDSRLGRIGSEAIMVWFA